MKTAGAGPNPIQQAAEFVGSNVKKGGIIDTAIQGANTVVNNPEVQGMAKEVGSNALQTAAISSGIIAPKAATDLVAGQAVKTAVEKANKVFGSYDKALAEATIKAGQGFASVATKAEEGSKTTARSAGQQLTKEVCSR